MIELGLGGTAALGDSLWLTPVTKKYKVKIILHNDRQSRWISGVYKGIADVEFSDNPPERIYSKYKSNTHSAQRILDALGITDVNCIPQVKFNEEELDWARNYISKYKNPIAIVNENSGINDPNNHRSHYVAPPAELMQSIANHLEEKGYDVLQFSKEKSRALQGVHFITLADVRWIMACYHVIGKMVSGDTGHYHAMLASGGKSFTLIPDESAYFGYSYTDLLYYPRLWKDEPVRVEYANYNLPKNEIINKIDSWLVKAF